MSTAAVASVSQLPYNTCSMNGRCAAHISNGVGSALQTAWGGIQATPSGLVGRKLLAAHPKGMLHHSGAAAAAGDGTKAKCPFATLKQAGLLRGLSRR